MITDSSPTATIRGSTFHALQLLQFFLQDELAPYNCVIAMPYRILAYWLLYCLKFQQLVHSAYYSQSHLRLSPVLPDEVTMKGKHKNVCFRECIVRSSLNVKGSPWTRHIPLPVDHRRRHLKSLSKTRFPCPPIRCSADFPSLNWLTLLCLIASLINSPGRSLQPSMTEWPELVPADEHSNETEINREPKRCYQAFIKVNPCKTDHSYLLFVLRYSFL